MAKLADKTARTASTALDTDMMYLTDAAGANDFKIPRGTFLQGNNVAVTATTDGLTTGLIPDGSRHVTVTSSVGTKVCVLPAGVVGDVITGYVDGNGFEMQTLASTSDKINDVDCSGANEAAVPATHNFTCTKVEDDHWLMLGYTSAGVIATIAPDTDA